MNKYITRFAELIDETYLYKVLSYLYYRPSKNSGVLEEEYASYGDEYPDKFFYIIRVNDPIGANGLMALVGYCLGHIRKAEKKHYIPVIDMLSYPNIYVNEADIGKYNAWEFFFDQPCGYSLKDISRAKNIILSSTRFPLDRPVFSSKRLYNNKKEFIKWNDLTFKYIHLKQGIHNRVCELWNDFFREDDIVLGVLYRGTDYSSLKIEGHPIQPSLQEMSEKIDDFIRRNNCNKIYLATEDKNAYDYFKKIYGEKMYINSIPQIDYDEPKVISEVYPEDTIQKKSIGENYLTSLSLLAKCDYFISGRNGGSLGTLLLTRGFKETYFFDLGIY